MFAVIVNSLWKGFILFALNLSSTFRWNCNLPKFFLERPSWIWLISVKSFLSLSSYLFVSYSSIYFIRFSMNTYSLPFIFFWRVKSEELIDDFLLKVWWAQVDSNHRPRAYQARALTTWAMSPFSFRYISFSLAIGGDDGNRTHDPLLAGQVLSQLSYTPI